MRAGTRDPLDRDYTPEALADACAAYLLAVGHVLPGSLWYDPCAGGAAFPRAIRRADPTAGVVASDMDPTAVVYAAPVAGVSVQAPGDFLTAPLVVADAVLTNPPFTAAEAFLRRAVLCADVVALVLPSTFRGGAERLALFQEGPGNGFRLVDDPMIIERPAFRSDGKTDATTYWLGIWSAEAPRAERRVITSGGGGWGRPLYARR